MGQYDTISAEYRQLKEQLRVLSSSDPALREEITSSIKETCRDLDRHLLEEYVDFEEICDNLPDAVYVADKNGTTIYVNDAYQQMSGITRSEVVGENIHHINREKKLYDNGVLPSVLKKQDRVESIGRMVRTNTQVYITGFPIFDKNGELKYAVAHDRNIQQLQILQDQLIRLKETKEKQNDEVEYLRRQQLGEKELIFKSANMYHAFATAMAVAPTDATVLITGESGTGKEILANEIFKASNRKNQPFLKVNCSAIPENLMESELFGYVPGSFTGASRQGKTGIFELANNGTLMLDEIGEMSIAMQTKLLRVLQNHEIQKVGDSKAIPVDVRIIAATNKDLMASIRDHTFREDLYYRLNVVPIQIPPLRERRDDVEPLVLHFLEHYNKKYNKQIELYSETLDLLASYDWPGNIRELRNVVERLVVVNRNGAVDMRSLRMILGLEEARAGAGGDGAGGASNGDNADGHGSAGGAGGDGNAGFVGGNGDGNGSLRYDLKTATTALERYMIKQALAQFGSKRKAAAALGIDHSTLVKKCQRLGVE